MDQMQSKRVVFSGRVKPSRRGPDGVVTHKEWAWVYNDSTVEVASDVDSQRCGPVDSERAEALEAAVKHLSFKLVEYGDDLDTDRA